MADGRGYCKHRERTSRAEHTTSHTATGKDLRSPIRCQRRNGGAQGKLMCRGREFRDRFSLRPLRSLHDLELDAVALIQRAKTAPIDGRVVDEYVRAIVLGNKAIPLLIVKPFHGTSCHCGHPPDMGEHGAATAARRRLKTALASVYPYAVPFNLTEITYCSLPCNDGPD
jgi:hypothetical protein